MEPVDALPGPKPISVAELDRKLKRALETSGTDLWVEGEVISLKAPSSGHLYFTLKDEREDAAIECVMYRTLAARGRRALTDGARVQVRGKATLWAPRGKLQFIVDATRIAGRGALLEALEQLKLKLAAEGLFAPERKRPLPTDPRIIGVVTSANGAAIHDIARVAFRRGGARILLAPALVQGAEAPEQIVAAIDRLERVNGVDVVIVGRGGGASDDLAAFQDERVVRRVASCLVPVVSAVGHEIDVTLTDLAADIRAATPSQAAELVVPESYHRERVLRDLTGRLRRAMHQYILESRVVLERLRAGLGDPRATLGDRQQLLDDLELRLREAAQDAIAQRKEQILRLHARLSAQHPKTILQRARGELQRLQAQLCSEGRRTLEQRTAHLTLLAGRLQGVSPLAVLGRGYSIALGPSGQAIRDANEVPAGTLLQLRLHRGSLFARVEKNLP
ncbi:MAG: exodeoxyribonuclease VII large subunit [Myxococcales bacterium]|nr:exodeoxyribonuclease VII large subunit [Polyangiaceae bacterium]MDW8250613.1 exodeoxyribonuclease VII large subunit [Myxococcales bacterium]